MFLKQIGSTVLAFAMIAAMGATAFATDTQSENQALDKDGKINTAMSRITTEVLKAEDILVATVPTELSVIVDTRGNVTVPANAKIINNSDKTITVSNIKVSVPNKYYIAKDVAAIEKLNSTNSRYPVWFYSLNDDTVKEGTIASNVDYSGYFQTPYRESDFVLSQNKWDIEANQELPLNMNVLPDSKCYSEAHTTQQTGTLTFTIAYKE